MAWSVLRSGGVLEVRENAAPTSRTRIVVNGFLLNILNPKLSLFFLAFLPQFTPAKSSGATLSMLVLAGVFMLLTFIVFVGYGAFAAAARRWVISQPNVVRWLKRGFAGAFAALGLRLALSD
jgi:threonine/homoserine/homoserine lactone efflux protein